jgi:hypothetical protein
MPSVHFRKSFSNVARYARFYVMFQRCGMRRVSPFTARHFTSAKKRRARFSPSPQKESRETRKE